MASDSDLSSGLKALASSITALGISLEKSSSEFATGLALSSEQFAKAIDSGTLNILAASLPDVDEEGAE